MLLVTWVYGDIVPLSSPRELDQSSELGPRIRIRVIFQWADKQATIVTSLQDDGCGVYDAFSITFDRERGSSSQLQWILYTFDVFGGRRGKARSIPKDTKRAALHRNARSEE